MKKLKTSLDLDVEILHALYKAAEYYLNNGYVTIKVNGYEENNFDLSVTEILKGKTDVGFSVFVEYGENIKRKVTVNKFECVVTTETIFSCIAKFEKFCSPKDRKRFTKGEEQKFIPMKALVMIYDWDKEKNITKRKNILKVTSHTAFYVKRSQNIYILLYREGSIWYRTGEAYSEEQMERHCSKMETPMFITTQLQRIKKDVEQQKIKKVGTVSVLLELYNALNLNKITA